jgi:16S rRNA (uracil1498-N3)-methyltransferase
MHLFYTPDISSEYYTLNEEESKHCVRVLRLQNADEVTLIDGRGGFYSAQILDANPKRTLLKINSTQREYGKRNHYLHIAIAPTKNIERTEWFIEKATEIGIDEISLIISDRSERKEVKPERLKKVITSAVKQSIKAYHPVLNEPQNFRNFIKQDFSEQKFIAHCIDNDKFSLKSELDLHSRYLVMIGPEGDFTPLEISQALESGFKPITLGESRLRTETAALEACFEINFLNR